MIRFTLKVMGEEVYKDKRGGSSDPCFIGSQVAADRQYRESVVKEPMKAKEGRIKRSEEDGNKMR